MTHADKTVPSDTSRPIIVTNRPILKDPMMSDTADQTEKKSAEQLQDSSKPNVKSLLQPTAPLFASPSEQTSENVKTTANADIDGKPVAEQSAPDNSDVEVAKDPEASEDIAASKQAEHKAAVQKLVDNKQYFLPINSVEKRRSKRFVALGVTLSLVLTVAWADVALDANLIHVTGIKAPTHFFSN